MLFCWVWLWHNLKWIKRYSGSTVYEKTDIKAKTIKVDTGKGNTIKVTMSYGEQSTLEELLIAYLGQEIAGGSAA